MSISGILESIRKIMRQDNGLNGDAQRLEQLGWMLFLKIFSDKDQELELLYDDYTRQFRPNFVGKIGQVTTKELRAMNY